MNEKHTEIDKRYIALLSYLWILFLIPLLIEPKDEFVKFHVKQGIVLFLFFVIIFIVGGVIPLIGWFVILPLGLMYWFSLFVLCIFNTLSGKKEKLPFIGKYADRINI
ncbi:MAG: hypothetical protein ABIN20_07165 [candidate division WOR-3 bacterium]